MVKSDGDFVVIVDLPEGEHQYKFVVDGKWEHDPNQVRLSFSLSLPSILYHLASCSAKNILLGIEINNWIFFFFF